MLTDKLINYIIQTLKYVGLGMYNTEKLP